MDDKNKEISTLGDFAEDIEAILVENGMLDDLIKYRDIKNRRLMITGEINQYLADEIAKNIMQYNRDDVGIPSEERKPIVLYISSPGGDVSAGLEIIDSIENSKTPVYTVNMSMMYSMGFFIGIAGHKRFAMKSSTYLLHDGACAVMNNMSKMIDFTEFRKRDEERLKMYTLSKTKITEEQYSKNYRMEWYMFSDTAKVLGVVDYIVGIDCDIDDII